jgi:hypothetical protein
LDDLPLRSVDPCFQAAVCASRHLDDVDRLVVTIDKGAVTAMDLPRVALDANFLVWQEATARFTVMPGCTFLPVNTAARLAVEEPEQAARAITWLALNDAVHAYIDASEESGPLLTRIARLVSRLELAVMSLATTAAILPSDAVAPIYEALCLLTPAVSSTAAAARGLTPGPAVRLRASIEHLYDRLPVAALLPTVDPRPID